MIDPGTTVQSAYLPPCQVLRALLSRCSLARDADVIRSELVVIVTVLPGQSNSNCTGESAIAELEVSMATRASLINAFIILSL